MTILTGGPEHLYNDQTPAVGPRDAGFTDGLDGNEPIPDPIYDRTERAAYYQGHCRGVLARIAMSRAEGHFTPAA